MKKQPDIISGKSWNNEQIPAIILIACGMYMVKWESSIIDLRIWDKKVLNPEPENLSTYKAWVKSRGF